MGTESEVGAGVIFEPDIMAKKNGCYHVRYLNKTHRKMVKSQKLLSAIKDTESVMIAHILEGHDI